jgi:hypothetical protein
LFVLTRTLHSTASSGAIHYEQAALLGARLRFCLLFPLCTWERRAVCGCWAFERGRTTDSLLIVAKAVDHTRNVILEIKANVIGSLGGAEDGRELSANNREELELGF